MQRQFVGVGVVVDARADRPVVVEAVERDGVGRELLGVEVVLRTAGQAPAVEHAGAGAQPDRAVDDFVGATANADSATLELMRDVELDLTIELGRMHMHLEDVLKLKQGAVVPLDKLAGDPADIYVNGRLIARGEVLVLNDNFCVRVAELIVGESACA